jgi:hypothetical protein
LKHRLPLLVDWARTAALSGFKRADDWYSNPPFKGDGAGDETRTRDIQLGRKEATARAGRVFKKALDSGMAHFL